MPTVRGTHAQQRLLVLWLGVAAPSFTIMVLQSLMGRYGTHLQDAWAWFLPTVMPTLLLVIGTVVTNGINHMMVDRRVQVFYWRLAASLSAFYLALVTCVLLMASAGDHTIDLMVQSNLYLAPIQGLVGAALGVFFVSSSND